MVRRTKEDAMETRAKLLDAAELLFGKNGVAHTSMAQVAEQAGVTRGAIYHHFRHKQDLIESLMDRVRLPIDEMREHIAELKDYDALKEIRKRTIEFLTRIQSNERVQALASILLHKCEYVDEVNPIKLRHVSGRNECIEDFETLFEKALQDQQLKPETDPRMAVIGLFGMVDGLIYNWLLDSNYFDLSEYGSKAIETYLDGLSQID